MVEFQHRIYHGFVKYSFFGMENFDFSMEKRIISEKHGKKEWFSGKVFSNIQHGKSVER
jgi:hypothetical protein